MHRQNDEVVVVSTKNKKKKNKFNENVDNNCKPNIKCVVSVVSAAPTQLFLILKHC